jgi:ABC-type dipeptide/oligopeptide/nickel transport system permease subunit
MQAGVFSILLAIAVGVPLGLVAGFYRGALDQTIMRLTDAWLAFPFLILAIGLVTIMGRRSRTRRSPSGSARRRPTSGSPAASCSRPRRGLRAGRPRARRRRSRLMSRHVLPNIVSSLLVQATISIPVAIIAEAVLSFLGLGVSRRRRAGARCSTPPSSSSRRRRGWPGGLGSRSSRSPCRSISRATGLRDLLDPRDY